MPTELGLYKKAHPKLETLDAILTRVSKTGSRGVTFQFSPMQIGDYWITKAPMQGSDLLAQWNKSITKPTLSLNSDE